MIYMVEMALLDTARRTEWDAWYVAHQHRLLSIPGFRASQRFEAIHAAPAPFVALHEVDSPEIFTGPTYRAQAGPSNTGEWQTKENGQLASQPVRRRRPHPRRAHGRPSGGRGGRCLRLPDRLSVKWMEAVGLDRSVHRRGLAVMPAATADQLVGTQGLRVLRPIGPRLRRRD